VTSWIVVFVVVIVIVIGVYRWRHNRTSAANRSQRDVRVKVVSTAAIIVLGFAVVALIVITSLL
jgi:multisubunit Na+/H+ antiporter MnhB subunit